MERFGEAGAVVEAEPERRTVRLEGYRRRVDRLADVRPAELRVFRQAARRGVAGRPAGIASVAHAVDRLERQVIAEQVAAVVGRPQLAGVGVPDEADRVAQGRA